MSSLDDLRALGEFPAVRELDGLDASDLYMLEPHQAHEWTVKIRAAIGELTEMVKYEHGGHDHYLRLADKQRERAERAEAQRKHFSESYAALHAKFAQQQTTLEQAEAEVARLVEWLVTQHDYDEQAVRNFAKGADLAAHYEEHRT